MESCDGTSSDATPFTRHGQERRQGRRRAPRCLRQSKKKGPCARADAGAYYSGVVTRNDEVLLWGQGWYAPRARTLSSYGRYMAYIVVAYILMAYIVTAYIVTAYIVMAYILMAYIVTAYIVMTYILMAYIGTDSSGSDTIQIWPI